MKKNWLRMGMVAVLGVFLLGSAIPALAGTADSASALPGSGGGFLRQRAQTMIQALADLTGKDLQQIRAERRSGQSVLAIAEENGISEQALTSKITGAHQERLQSLLQEGKITQQQYNTCVEQMDQRIKERLNAVPNGGQGAGSDQGRANGQGRGQGKGRGMGPGNGVCLTYQP